MRYGVEAALTLDEFALWLNLEDMSWARPGHESIDAIVLFGALLLIVIWGAFSRRWPGSCGRGSPQEGDTENHLLDPIWRKAPN